MDQACILSRLTPAVTNPKSPLANNSNPVWSGNAGWRMPALALLERPTWSLGRRVAIAALAGYVVLSIVMLTVKAIQLAIGT